MIECKRAELAFFWMPKLTRVYCLLSSMSYCSTPPSLSSFTVFVREGTVKVYLIPQFYRVGELVAILLHTTYSSNVGIRFVCTCYNLLLAMLTNMFTKYTEWQSTPNVLFVVYGKSTFV